VSGLDLEAIADAAEAAVYAQHHKDLCGCDRWPDSCPHFPKERTLFSVNAYDVVVAAAPLIEKALVERILADAMSDHDDDSNPFSAALKARTKRVRETIAVAIEQTIPTQHRSHPPTCQSCITRATYIQDHAAIARGAR
jgi:hypothetical protein